MKKRDKMKMMGILILLLAVITVAITFNSGIPSFQNGRERSKRRNI